MPETRWIYDNDSLDALARTGVPVFAADFVLRHAEPIYRGHIFGVALLRVVGRDQRAEWLMIHCVEIADDIYRVHNARYLDDAEAGIAIRLLLGRNR